VFKNGNLRVGTLLTFLLGFGLFGSTFIIPVYTQSTLGWSAFQAGMLMVPSAVATAFLMPIIGKILSKGVPQQLLISMGMLFFAIFCFWGYFILTNDTAGHNLFWILVTRGIGLPLLFIPVTTLSLSTLKGPEIGQGIAFTAMMRQLGGSFGIALITTFLARRNMFHRSDLVTDLNVNNPAVAARVHSLQQGFISNGFTPDIALKSAYKALDYSVTAQANVLSYMDIFYYLGILFLVCIPFMLFVKRGKPAAIIADSLH
jgi:DHA2 family multidrug resistance protein